MKKWKARGEEAGKIRGNGIGNSERGERETGKIGGGVGWK